MSLITSAKSKVGGAMYVAAAGATLPTTSAAALASDFACMGCISDAGMTRSQSVDTQVIKDWAGTVVAALNNGKTETLKCAFIDTENADMLKAIYGTTNVTVASGKITVKSTGAAAVTPHAYVCEMILVGNKAHRICVPAGYITEIGDITYVGSDVIKYEVTITCAADASGVSVYEYIG